MREVEPSVVSGKLADCKTCKLSDGKAVSLFIRGGGNGPVAGFADELQPDEYSSAGRKFAVLLPQRVPKFRGRIRKKTVRYIERTGTAGVWRVGQNTINFGSVNLCVCCKPCFDNLTQVKPLAEVMSPDDEKFTFLFASILYF